MQRLLVEDTHVEAHTSVDTTDALLLQGARPAGEEGVGHRLAVAVGAEHGIATADDVDIAVEDTVTVDLATDAQLGGETEVAAQTRESHTSGEELVDRSRHHRHLRVIGIDHLALGDIVDTDRQGAVLHACLAVGGDDAALEVGHLLRFTN